MTTEPTMRAHDRERDRDDPSPAAPDRSDVDRDPMDPEAVRRAIRERSQRIKRQELDRAFDRLQARGTLTEEKRAIVERLATAIVEGVLLAPDAALADADDHETVRTAVELFDPDR